MGRTVAIGVQDFSKLRENNYFYIDKTSFIKEWWEKGDDVTLIIRPRRFGKTMTMSMLDYFFSNRYTKKDELFKGLEVWKTERMKKLQGSYPVIFLSFAGVKGQNFEDSLTQIKKQIVSLYSEYSFLWDSKVFDYNEREALKKISEDMSRTDTEYSLNLLSKLLKKYYKKKVLIFLDEYDTPMQEAYINGYWKELTAFIRTMFNNTFKTNPSMERAIMTGVTRVSKESIFSDLNNLNVVTTTSDEYAATFGFTEEEVFQSMDEMCISEERKEEVKRWYDGFTFGTITDIYNPWSIISFLSKRKLDIYWANTSGNSLVGNLLRGGNTEIKIKFEELMNGNSIVVPIDEQIIFEQLDTNQNAIWSLLLASGYLKVLEHESYYEVKRGRPKYTLALTNFEVHKMFENLVLDWFSEDSSFGEFVSGMLKGDVKSMNRYINRVALNTFSFFDSGKKPSDDATERFYHGFVLGLLVEHAPDYIITSNRESGFGRYDVILEPKNKSDVAVILEFKVFDKEDQEKDLADTAESALKQIEEKKYEADLLYRGVMKNKIFKYGLAFRGKECLIKKGN